MVWHNSIFVLLRISNSLSIKFSMSLQNAFLGSLVADAVAIPVHWYHNRESLDQDYGDFSVTANLEYQTASYGEVIILEISESRYS